ncbi:MAG: smalltalk protein [Bacteroidaceae bacterium]|nr:smalltalk protein [Bacteroidaceae bacterium]MBR6629275.1 smalltalk protein [Bacteroidaceae bacterium]
MKINWKQILKIVITVLTALAGALGIASCAV